MAAPVPEIPVMPSGGNIDINQLTGLFATKQAFADLEKRLGACEIKNDNQDKNLDNHEQRIVSLENMCKDFTSKMNALARQIASLGDMPAAVVDEPKGDIDTNAVLAMIKKLQFELQQKVDAKDLEHLKLLVDSKADKNDVMKEMDRMDKNINDLKRLVLSLEEKVKLIERELKQVNQYIEMLQKQIKNLPPPVVQAPQESGVND